MRRDFSLDSAVKRATLYSTARGFYEARLSGRKVSEDLLAPGFTDFHKRISYETYDVTALVHKGRNTISALLGYGWYAGHMNLGGNAYLYGYFPQFAAQLDIELRNGRHLTICSDKHWQTTLDERLRWSDLLDGEATDFRKEQSGWDGPGFSAKGWKPAWSQNLGPERLVAQKTPPVRVTAELNPVSVHQVRPGVWVYDLGQEITGWIRLKLDGKAGTHIIIRHAEAVKPDGELDTASLWGAPQQDDYFLDGKGPRRVEPHFTYHGFRYFEVSGMASPPQSIVATYIHTNVEDAGSFGSSNPLFDALMRASRFTQQNLMFDVPAGCAARSERLAWTGDIRPCVQTALFNFDTAAFFEKYSADLRDDQKPDGRFTDICPHAHLTGTEICVGSPGWADAGVSLPWDVYVNTGDRQLLAAHYEAAKRWVDFINDKNPRHLWVNARGMDWGDWLSAGRATPKEIGSTAFFAHSADLVSRMAKALGCVKDERTYRTLFDQIRASFASNYVSPDGVIRLGGTSHTANVAPVIRRMTQFDRLSFTVGNEVLGGDPALNLPKILRLKILVGSLLLSREYPEGGKVDLMGSGNALRVVEATYGATQETTTNDDAQGSYALALRFGLLDEPLRTKAAQRLLKVIARDGAHPSTGFWSSIEMMLALSDSGSNAQASRLVDLTSAPSWGYMVKSGGTTFWEAFDADKKTLSLNHWTHSSCGEWLWRDVAGLNPDADHPGYVGFTIRPRPTPEVSWTRARYRSIRGPVEIDWASQRGRFRLGVLIPPGSVAKVYIPEGSTSIKESGLSPDRAKGVRFLRMDSGATVYEVKSGSYSFTAMRRDD